METRKVRNSKGHHSHCARSMCLCCSLSSRALHNKLEFDPNEGTMEPVVSILTDYILQYDEKVHNVAKRRKAEEALTKYVKKENAEKACVLCKRDSINPFSATSPYSHGKNTLIGPFSVQGNRYWCHRQCALWCPEVLASHQLSNFTECQLNNLLPNPPTTIETIPKILTTSNFKRIGDAIKRSRNLRCALCKDTGATIGCAVPSCTRSGSFHYDCACRSNGELLVARQCLSRDGMIRVVRLYFCDQHLVCHLELQKAHGKQWKQQLANPNEPVDLVDTWKELTETQKIRLSRRLYIAEEIIESRIELNIQHHLIKWLGWDANQCSWEQDSRFIDRTILPPKKLKKVKK